MKFPVLLFTWIIAGTSALAQSGLGLYAHKMGVLPMPANSVVLGNLGKLDPATQKTEWITTLTAGDLPIDLPLGEYVLERPNGFSDKLALTQETPVVYLTVDYQPGPFGVFWQDGQMHRTDGFALRAPDEVLDAMQDRWPYFRERPIVPMVRPGLTPDQRASGLARLRKLAETDLVAITAVLGDNILRDLPLKDRDKINQLSDTRLATALAGLGALGTREDAETLFAQAEGLAQKGAVTTWPDLIKTAVMIESRLAILGSGQAAASFDNYMAGTDSPIYPLIINELAALGYRPALSYLINALPAGELPSIWDGWDRARAFSSLVRFESPALYNYALRIIDEYRAQQIRSLTDQPWQASALSIETRVAILPAMLYAATRTPGNDHDVSFPIPQTDSYLMALAPALDDPAELFNFFLNKPDEIPLHQMTSMICPAIAGRRADPALLDRLYGAVLRRAVSANHIRPEWLAQKVISVGLTNCLLTPHGLQYIETSDQEAVPVHPLPWLYGLADISEQANKMLATTAPYIHYRLLDPAPDSWVIDALGSRASEPAVSDYLHYRQFATTAGHYETGPYNGNVMLRMFMMPFRDQPEAKRQVWAWGEVGLRIQSDVENDTVYFGLSVQSVGHAENGLAATMARDPELIATNVVDGGIGMIEKVVFRNSGGPRDLDFKGAMSNGLHAYTLTGTGTDVTNAVVDVYFAPKNLDGQPINRWVVSFPLHDSVFAFESRLHKGSFSFE